MTYRSSLLVAAALFIASPALAQTATGNAAPNNPAVNNTGMNNSDVPVKGANSFTEGQAKSRIESSGYTNVSNVMKDDQGVWHAMASKNGAESKVTVDFQGNVNPVK